MNTKRFYRIQEVCQVTGLSKGGIYKLIRESKFPPPVKLTERSSGWPDDQVMHWVEAKISNPVCSEKPKRGTDKNISSISKVSQIAESNRQHLTRHTPPLVFFGYGPTRPPGTPLNRLMGPKADYAH